MSSATTHADPFDALVNAVAERVLERLGTAQPAAKRLLSLKEAGECIGGKSASSIRGMINAGTIPADIVKRIGTRRVFLDKIEFDKWISAQ